MRTVLRFLKITGRRRESPAIGRGFAAAAAHLDGIAHRLPGPAGAGRGRMDASVLPRLLSGLGLVAGSALALGGPAVFGARGAGGAFVTAAVLWLVMWFQATAALLGRARLGWPGRMIPGLVGLLALVGVGVDGLLLFVASEAGTASAAALALRAGALLFLLGLAFAVACNVVLGWRFDVLARWVVRQRDALAPAAAYGAGLGLLAVTLGLRFGHDGVAGVLLLAALVLLAELALQSLLDGMRAAVRNHGVSPASTARMRRWLLAYGAFFGLAPALFGAAGALMPALSFTAASIGLHFALLGSVVALVTLAMALRQERRPATWVLVAGGLAIIGVPAGLALTTVYVATLLWLLLLSGKAPRFAVLFL